MNLKEIIGIPCIYYADLYTDTEFPFCGTSVFIGSQRRIFAIKGFIEL